MLQTFCAGDLANQTVPNYTFCDHSVRITGIYIGNCIRCIRIFTTSVDKTCKVSLWFWVYYIFLLSLDVTRLIYSYKIFM